MTFLWLVVAATFGVSLSVACARITRQYALCAVAFAGVLLVLHAHVYLDYVSDDSYISYRYARNLADGIGPFWNAGERVEGYSNFLWVVALAGSALLGFDIESAATWLGLILGIAGSLGTYQLTRTLLPSDTGHTAGLIAAVLLPCSTTWALWSMSGLEGPLFAALILVAVLLQLREAQGAAISSASGAAWALACMTRLDGLVLVGVSAVFRLGALLLRSRQPANRGAATELAAFGTWSGAFTLVFVPYFIWRWATYGWLMPNTYYAKVGAGLEQYQRGIDYSVGFLNESGLWVLGAVPLAVAFTSVRRYAALYVLTLVTTWLAYISYVGGDFMPHYRFFAPIMPLAFALIAASVGGVIVAHPIDERRGYRLALGGASAVALLTIVVFVLEPSTDAAIRGERELMAVRNEQGRWLRENVPETTTIAVYGAGAIPYQSRLPSIDILGLNDEHIAHRDVSIGEGMAAHEKYDSTYVLDRRPEIIILADYRTASPWERDDYERLAGYTTIPGIADLIAQERLWQDYEPRAYGAENGLWFNMLVHRDANAVLARTQSARLRD